MFPIPPFVVEDEKIVMETNLTGKKKKMWARFEGKEAESSKQS